MKQRKLQPKCLIKRACSSLKVATAFNNCNRLEENIHHENGESAVQWALSEGSDEREAMRRAFEPLKPVIKQVLCAGCL